jgi:hypothetical protein
MKRSKIIADRFREVILNGTWIANTNFKDQLSSLSWQQATTKIGSLNTIAALTFHINYYLAGVSNVLEGGPLDIRDKYSFDLAPITSQEDWASLMQSMWDNADKFAGLVEALPDHKLDEVFIDPKYGTFQRNIEAMIEHSYYHLGQVTLIKKMVLEKES